MRHEYFSTNWYWGFCDDPQGGPTPWTKVFKTLKAARAHAGGVYDAVILRGPRGYAARHRMADKNGTITGWPRSADRDLVPVEKVEGKWEPCPYC